MNFYGQKIIYGKTNDIHCHWANNKGRGCDNLTISVVKKGSERPFFTRGYKAESLVYQTRKGSWRGSISLSKDFVATWIGEVKEFCRECGYAPCLCKEITALEEIERMNEEIDTAHECGIDL